MPKVFIWIVIIIAVALGALAIFGNNSGSLNTNNQSGIQSDLYQSQVPSVQEGNQKVTIGGNNQSESNMNAKIVTNKGEILVELFNEKVPNTAGNFAKLASEGFYNGVRFHRVIKGFMIQTGDPNSKDLDKKPLWGTGGPGYKFEDEFGEGLSNVTGTLSMANSGPNTNGSQFFINTVDNIFLDNKHAVFGKVIEGMDIVNAIENTETLPGDVPAEDIIIQSIEVLN